MLEIDTSKPAGSSKASALNGGCFCKTLDQGLLATALDREAGLDGFAEQLAATHPTLFSNVAVFVPASVMAAMMRIVDAVEAAARLPAFREAALSSAPSIAAQDFGPIGAFMGYDFHVTPAGPKLIEVNTNAGGAFLNAVLAQAQITCCGGDADRPDIGPVFGAAVTQMFKEEWLLQKGEGKPRLIAIVDDEPKAQHLYPEFQLAKALLETHGIATVIADPCELVFDEGALSFHGRTIDLVYNRLVDFGLSDPRHEALRAAYAEGAAVVTPNPRVHALLADKRILALLSDFAKLKAWGLDPRRQSVLASGTLKTVVVNAENSGDLWRDRRGWFFKPARGHGSKAAYRGEKLTRRVWAEIAAGEYVAQEYAAPATRDVSLAGEQAVLKCDVRLYTYAGSLLIAAARLYQGQTTNMRTQGGGFAPVLVIRGEWRDREDRAPTCRQRR